MALSKSPFREVKRKLSVKMDPNTENEFKKKLRHPLNQKKPLTSKMYINALIITSQRFKFLQSESDPQQYRKATTRYLEKHYI